MSRAVAVAHANIALIKYWGKADVTRNLPAVPSLSLTLDGLSTRTELEFDPGLIEDKAFLDDVQLSGKPFERVKRVLDRLRERASTNTKARVISHNHFPTAAGLASSASGFAALVAATSAALGLGMSLAEQSSVARWASASAARSIFPGWVQLRLAEESAEELAPRNHLEIEMLVAVTRRGPKPIGSTAAMQHTLETSPYYPAWVESAPAVFERGKAALLAKDLHGLGHAMEHSTLLMHASMLAADPGVLYLAPASIALIDCVRSLRESGVEAFFTMDAGPHVKVLTRSDNAAQVARALEGVPGVLEVLRCTPGPGVEILEAP
ncbi:MAG: diphosphomevalonate decarboxylase [Polyangiaceae bacterium]|nr:diphosphomevalonate decarboxylase [Polyangiaceae bacterium]MCB9605422.1 diphosphomevalonate decarboxylase [Polyangiaceae bacterium]